MNKTTLQAALAAVLATKGETPLSAVDSQGVKRKLTVAQRAFNKVKEDAETYFDNATQQAALADYVTLTTLRKDASDIQQQCWAGVAAVFPGTDAPTWHQIDVMKRSVGLHISGADWIYQCTIIGLRRLESLGATYNGNGTLLELGELPARNGGKKKGKREKSVARFQTSNAKDLMALRKRMKEYKSVVDAKALAMYAEALRLFGEAIKLDRKAS